MSQYYSEFQTEQIITLFDQLIQTTHLMACEEQLKSLSQKAKKAIEFYSSFEARQVLMQLIQKNKSLCQHKNWKVNETNYLIFIVVKYCLQKGYCINDLQTTDWDQISRFVPNRESSVCHFRFLALFPTSISHAPWSISQRELLLQIIQNQNSNNLNWKCISETLYEKSSNKVYRTGKQCREHYTCFLRPNLKKGPWTDSEDYQLITLFLKLGKKWSKMTKYIEGRNQNSIKNRFFLMFENKKELRLTNSDLVKLVKRKREKLERKLVIANQNPIIYEQLTNLTPIDDQSSNFQLLNQQEQIHDQIRLSVFRSGIFLSDRIEEDNYKSSVNCQGDMSLSPVDEFEKYIDL